MSHKNINKKIECKFAKSTSLKQSENIIRLSKMEISCLVLMCKGKTFKEIGVQLNISPKTVSTYISRAKEKMGCYSRSKLFEVFTNLSSESHSA